ncbi:MAG TPA: DUF6364 family protein [Bryobacteraceae bacterium]
MSKLTLSVDPAVVARAKRSAQRRGTSVSKLVEAYLDSLDDFAVPDAPVLRSLRGILKRKTDVETYRRYLDRKYR